MYGLSKLTFITTRLLNVLIYAFTSMAICEIAVSMVYSQSDTATLSGIVYDEQKSPIADASITLTKIDTSTKRTVITNNQGIYVFVSLSPGVYELTVERSGFAPRNYKGIVLNVGDRKIVSNIELKVGSLTESVTVSGVSLINNDGSVGAVIDNNFVANLPLNGRSFISLIAATPGVILTTATSSEAGQFSVNGQRANANYFSIDGTSGNAGISPTFNLGQSAGGALPGLGALGSTSNLISIDALQEFAVMTSTYAPEYGRTPGAQVLMVTRSGTNTLTGSMYNYFRNDVLDANDWFANTNNVRKAMMRNNNFGGVLGGPIIKDKTFYFFSYEGVRLRQPRFAITEVPSLSLRQHPDASNDIKLFLNAYPKPNRSDIGNGASQFVSSFSNPTSMNAASIRIDQNLTNNISLFGRYNYSPSSMKIRGASQRSLNIISSISANTNTLTLGSNLSFSSRLNTEFRFNYTNFDTSYTDRLDDFGGAVPVTDSAMFVTPYNSSASYTLFYVDAGRNTVLAAGKVASNKQRQTNLVGNVSIDFGKHQIKLGGDYRRLAPIYGVRQLDQLAYFSGFAGADDSAEFGSVLSGLPWVSSLTASDPNSLFITNWSTYGQDTWRLSSRLVITYGIRWEINPAPRGDKPLTVGKDVNNPDSLSLDFSGTPIFKTKYRNIAPRSGISYLLSEKQGRETVIRGGFGVFYDLGTGSIGNVLSSFPYSRTLYLPFGTEFPIPTSLAIAPLFTTAPPYLSASLYDPKLLLPRTYQWNFAVEQSLGKSQSLKLSYVAAIGRNLLRQDQQYVWTNPLFDPSSTVSITRSIATSDYHALQLSFQRRLSKGFQAMLSYTMSKSLDNISNDSSTNLPIISTDKSLDRGYSDFDARHNINTAFTYQVPVWRKYTPIKKLMENWQVDSIVTVQSGTPFNVVYFRELPGIGFALARPDLVQGVNVFVKDPIAPGGTRLNRDAFISPVEERQGMLGRNVLRGFSAWQVNLGLRRQFNLTEKINFMFGAQAFNLFNHPNFSNPDGFLDSPGFGNVTMLGNALSGGSFGGGLNSLYQFGGPRSMQLFLKLNF